MRSRQRSTSSALLAFPDARANANCSICTGLFRANLATGSAEVASDMVLSQRWRLARERYASVRERLTPKNAGAHHEHGESAYQRHDPHGDEHRAVTVAVDQITGERRRKYRSYVGDEMRDSAVGADPGGR